ncbi:conserved Plasmodium protein, unknown function [Plasmodium ovale]|uniref:Uncharacterized protein n=2 Tax=Plasmodium ovale TaxID=36330 RepID=A0A1A8W0K2_PLAOA|nr:conserved Plasmodium protein, unknown function [Plasmodium ovale curtisi]SBS96807.1 conserved Plasmodium protein, unknown function [Plasmodium ovale curtisi]SCP05632.1 conserved Plasmodium protein, unknown function [Plasmodium ovale]
MLCKSEKDVLRKILKKGKNDTFPNFTNISEKCGNKIMFRNYVTEKPYLRIDFSSQNGFTSLLDVSNRKKPLFYVNLRKCFSSGLSSQSMEKTNESGNSISSPCGKNSLSILNNPNVLIIFDKNERETIGQKIYRYLDITGFLTRYNNRKEWILDLDPYTRLSTVMLTEYERKLMIFLKFHVYLLFVVCVYLWYHAQVHFTMKPPCPKPYAYGHLDGRKRDFTWHGKLFFVYPKMRCKECRWLDIQCKKECFEKLKQEGHKFFINNGDPLSVPKTVLYPSHFH